MQPRLDSPKVAPAAFYAMPALENYVRKSSRLEPSLPELVRMRASQINGCAYCLTVAVAAINAWNRLSISFRAVPGEYQPSTRGRS